MDRNDKAIRQKQLGFLLIVGGMLAMVTGPEAGVIGVLVAFVGLGLFIAGRLNQ